ncbi:MAG TPA: hypothetical protein VFL91_14115 [Thermomicrobiales bacterium]|nr:hypothetical protein [Thermomicrobiales bacterium]
MTSRTQRCLLVARCSLLRQSRAIHLRSLEDFKQHVTILPSDDAERIRQRYIDTFVDVTSAYYRDSIATLRQYSDGVYYSGYLWDTLKHPQMIPEKAVLRNPAMWNETVYAFWDLHSSEKIVVKDYWEYQKNAVLELRYRDLIAGLAYLPEDIYIAATDFSWTLILTHESWEGVPRYCLKAMP